ncbi:AbiTii domain-containing protein [Bacillus cereus]|uniref:AbiTii domain-containing protein n=1 Tax=Bacillus cereus TaxID=1396 RepID=UPI000BFE6DA5|nr:hypothetical protein [Bacillus cereus]PGU46913.1 hypothetical protein COD91_06840 [Bacillus cereus]
MESIVLELQREATSSSSNISDMLRKALIVARKLKVIDFENWLVQEMNGYKLSARDETPDYRVIVGQVQYLNPYHGWSSVIIKDEKVVDFFDRNKVAEPITELENLVNNDSKFLYLQLPQVIQNILIDYFQETAQFRLRFGKSQAKQIIDNIRNIILEWALKLEEDGIMGEGLSFSDKEKEEAKKQNYTVNHFNVNAPISSLQLQQNTVNSTQTMTNGVNVEQISNLISQLKENLNQAGLQVNQQRAVEAEVETISAELASAQPTVIQKSLQSIRTMLEGAGGNLAASGLMFMIDKIPF